MEPRKSVEIQARTREEATELALEQLGVTADEVDVQVLAEHHDDFYGDGEVLIRVSLKRKGGNAPVSGNRRDPEPAPPRHEPRHQAATASHPTPAPRPVRQYVPDDVIIEYETQAKDIVRELLERLNIEADVVAVDNPSVMPVGADDPPTVFIDINGRDLGLLIGRRGENLQQLQYVVNLLMNKGTEEWVRVILDVEGYRIRREESLIGLAERIARQVARNGRPISLEPMPPNERRIVHLTLQENGSVSTESSGSGDMRRVTVYPAE